MQKNETSIESAFIVMIVNSANRRRLVAQQAVRILNDSSKAKPFVVIK